MLNENGFQQSNYDLRSRMEENNLKSEMIKASAIKNIRKKYLEQMIQNHLSHHLLIAQEENTKKIVNNLTKSLKILTFEIILRIAGAIFQSLVSLSACIVYVANTYYQNDERLIDIFAFFEILFASLFSIDYALGFYKAKNKSKFFFNLLNFTDLMTILPVFVSYVPGGETKAGNSLKKFIGLVRILRVFRILRLYRLFQSSGLDQNKSPFSESSEVKKKIFVICATIMAIVFISTGIIFSLSQLDINFVIAMPIESEVLTFDSAFYYMVVTICTVGYGDIRPRSELSRIIIGIFIILFIVLLSKQTSELNELMKYNSQYKIPYHGKQGSQIILLGNITANTLQKFLKEFYHSDHHMKLDMKVVLIQHQEPSKEIIEVMSNPKYEEHVHYITGSIFKEEVMNMAKLKKSKVFILSNQYSIDSKKDDTFALLATKSIHEYDHTSKIFVQLVDPEFLLHSWADWDVVMSTQSYKMGIIASNVFNPGFSTFISNLIISTSVSSRQNSKFPNWVIEYCNGLSQELYCVSLSGSQFIGQRFQEVVEYLYSNHGILLLGVRTKIKESSNTGEFSEILMNPIDYDIQYDDEAVLIAKNQEIAINILRGHISPTYQPQFNKIKLSQNEIKDLIVQKSKLSNSKLDSDHYFMWETDLQGKLENHIIVFGQVDHLPALILALRHYSDQIICFVSDEQPGERWAQLKQYYSNLVYLEATLTNVEDLSRTAIKDSYHVILLTWFVPEASLQDSGILPIMRIIEENFKEVKFTLELVDESNLKYLNFRPLRELSNVSYNIWPRYCSSNVYFSGTMDYLMAQAFHSESIIEIVGKLINSNISPNISGIDENNEIHLLNVPQIQDERFRYIELFKTLVNQQRQLIPLAIIRPNSSFENKIGLPYVVINPQPLAPINKDDLILFMGRIDKTNSLDINQDNISMDRVKENISYQKKQDKLSQSDQLLNIAQKLIEEDELLDIQNPDLQKLMELELGISAKNREIILKQNDEMKQLLIQYNQVKNHVFKKV